MNSENNTPIRESIKEIAREIEQEISQDSTSLLVQQSAQESTQRSARGPLLKIKKLSKNVRIFLKILFVGILIFAAWYLNASLAGFGILVYGILRILIKPHDRESFIVALICLALIPFLLAFKLEAIAEQMAVNAYFFLLVGCLSRILDPVQTAQ